MYPRDEALNMAREQGIDLVEIAPNANPPVCKLIDFKKFKYQENKKDRENRKKSKVVELKQIRLRPFIGDNDFNIRVKKTKEFLADGHRVKISVQFYGRQLAHKEFGFKIFEKMSQEVAEVGKLDKEAKFEGKQLVGYYMPQKKENHAKTEN